MGQFLVYILTFTVGGVFLAISALILAMAIRPGRFLKGLTLDPALLGGIIFAVFGILSIIAFRMIYNDQGIHVSPLWRTVAFCSAIPSVLRLFFGLISGAGQAIDARRNPEADEPGKG
jgi:hypothetical protein